MPVHNISPKATGLKGFQLSTNEDMWTATKWLSARGYDAHVNYASNSGAWSLWLSKGSMNSSGNITDYIVVENDQVVRGIVSAADFAVLYQVN